MKARALIVRADEIARDQGMNQAQWSAKAGRAVNGQTVSRIISKGDCRMSTFLALLKPLGLTLDIVPIDDSSNKRLKKNGWP